MCPPTAHLTDIAEKAIRGNDVIHLFFIETTDYQLVLKEYLSMHYNLVQPGALLATVF